MKDLHSTDIAMEHVALKMYFPMRDWDIPAMLVYQRVHPRNLTYSRYQKWPYFQGVHLFQDPSFWNSILGYRGCIMFFSRWWFQTFFHFHPHFGEDSHFDYSHIFQMG